MNNGDKTKTNNEDKNNFTPDEYTSSLIYVFAYKEVAPFTCMLDRNVSNEKSPGAQLIEFIDKSIASHFDTGSLLSFIYNQCDFTTSWRTSSFQPYKLVSSTVWVRF